MEPVLFTGHFFLCKYRYLLFILLKAMLSSTFNPNFAVEFLVPNIPCPADFYFFFFGQAVYFHSIAGGACPEFISGSHTYTSGK